MILLIKRFTLSFCLLMCLGLISESASAQERLCDTSFEDCRQPLWTLIDNEQISIDVALWFIQDTSLSQKIINRHNAGVRVRILVDPRANPTYSGNEAILNQLKNAGIPMRYKVGGGILHWKMMLFEGQNTVEFSGANYGPFFFVPNIPYQDYIDEAIYFTGDPAVVNSFKTKYDDLWTDTVDYANYGNITGPLTRVYPTFPIDPAMNFPPSADGSEDFYNRSAYHINQENQKIDIIMYRHTNDRYTARTVEARGRGVPVRMITEQQEYRNLARQWDAYNIDLLYNAGVQIRIRNHQGLNHEKAVLLYGQGLTIFGSSNWTGPSSNSQQEHNYFTTKTWFFNWFVDHFNRKWNSSETQPFTPLAPDAPSLLSPSDGATGQPTANMVLSWEGGPWAHKFDIYFGTSPNPSLIATDQFLGRVDDGVVERYTLQQPLTPGTTYYWRIVGKTMANVTATGPIWRFTTAGVPGPAPTITSISPNSGSTVGGTSVTITGTNFQSGATVRIGGTAATSVNVVSSTSITAVTPAHAAGAVDVVVTNTDTQSGTLTNGFTYISPPPPPPGTEVVLYASEASVKVGNWQVVSDATAAGGARIHNPDQGAAKRGVALANPTDYFEITFNAQANTPYHLWIRGKAQSDYWGNDSIFIQFSGSVTSGQAATYRIGTTSATEMNLEDCSGCGIQGWGWQDNGWGVGVQGPAIYFQTTGTQTLRVQVREDGLSIDQIVLSPTTYLNSSPGALKNDATILPRSGGPGSGPAPTISSVSPATGPTSGGSTVTITGTGFQAGAGATFGGTAATNVVVTSATQITATTSSHAAGAVNVVVTNSDGQSGTLTNGFTYTAPPPPPAPTVTTVSPASGSTTGGTAVTITGTGFQSGANITFGGASATNVSVTSATQITATSPAHSAGAVNVVVTNLDGQSGTLTNGFTYTAPPPPPAPTVTTVSPSSGSTTGGTSVMISGTGFQSGAGVTFGGTAATNVTVTNATQITATTPSHAAGAVNVIVTNSDGQSGTLTNGFTFTQPPPTPAPTVSSIAPTSGSTLGGTSVTITGTNFQSGATVRIGGTAATSVNVVSSTSITAVTPAHSAGAVDIVVTNTDTQSGTLTNGFTYNVPPPPTETILLQDDFNDNSLNTSKWTANNLFSGFTDSSVLVTETQQRIEFGPLLRNVGGSHYNGIKSASTFGFTNGYAYVEFVQSPASNTAADAMFTLGNSVDNYYRIYFEGGTLFGQKRINAVKATLFSAPFNAVNDRYWRIRHDSVNNRVILETAPDNNGVPGTWTQRYSETWSSAVNLATVQFEVKGGTWQVEANVPGTVIFDNFKAARQ